MRILFATSECAPFSKSGGLADVAFSLPPALKRGGDEIEIVTPLYQCVIKNYGDQLTYVKSTTIQLGYRKLYCGLYKGERDGVPVWFIDNKEFFDRPRLYGYDDDLLRFAFFSKAIIDLLPEYGIKPQIIHANDWETALTIIYLEDKQVYQPDLRTIKTVYTIHNIAYQGQYGSNMISDVLGLDWGWFNGGLSYEYEGRQDINLMKGAMMIASAVSTVSPNYARELHSPKYAFGLQGVVDMIDRKLYGILNGIDEKHYDPSIDPIIPANFTVDDMSGKAACKEYIQEAFGLKKENRWPLLASVARLVEQKGIELVKQVLPGLMDMGCQLIVFGQGDKEYIDYFNWAKEQWPGQLGFSSDYTEAMASKIFAGADMYLMPSRFEPCGLSQMMAMRYGTVPIVHETGGLKDSVRPYSSFDGVGDGFAFNEYSAKYLYLAIVQAVRVYLADRETFDIIKRRCMEKDFSWEKSADEYRRMYNEISDNKEGALIPFDEAYETLKALYIRNDVHAKKAHADIDATRNLKLQLQVIGRAVGVMTVHFYDGEIHIANEGCTDADAYIESSYDNFVDMANGEDIADKLFMKGQLRISGNLAKGYYFRTILSPFIENKE